MKEYKDLSRWRSETHGGEWRCHADFTVEDEETFTEAFAQLFERTEDGYFRDKGILKKIHFEMSVFEVRGE